VRLRLTERTIKGLPAPDPSGKQKLHWDEEPKGFGVLCSGVTRKKTFVLQRAVNGRTRRITIAPVLGVAGEVEAARAKARQKLADFFYKGIDPKDAPAGGTLRQALAVYISSRTLKPRSAASYRDAVERLLTDWLDLPLSRITPAMVLDRHGLLTKASGRAAADGTMRVLRAVYNGAAYLAADRSLPPNPVRLRGTWHRTGPRTGHVRLDELAAFHLAVTSLASPVGRDLILLLLYTGFRRREATTLRWQDVDLDAGVIRLAAAATKSRRTLELPTSDLVYDLLRRRREVGDAGWVFPANSKSGHVEEPRHFLDQVARATGIVVSVHDLRRTFVSVAESTEMSVYALKALVNHAVGGDVTAGYVQHSVERLRVPAQRVADELRRLCRIE
jgi:integrase